MILDIHTHYIPLDSLVTAVIVGKRYGLKLKRDERGRDVAKREGKWVLGPLKAEFYDLNLRMSIMVGRKFISRRSTPQTMSSRSRS